VGSSATGRARHAAGRSWRTAGQFRPGPPPALTSAAYTRSYRESKAYGSAASSVRSPEQTDTALFWGLGRPDAQYNEGIRGIIASAGLNRIQAARALALANLVTADAYIACFDAKYAYSAWRPYTAIRGGDTDGNPATIADPAWTPLVKTPNHPEYPANHACVTTSYAKTIDYLLGRRHFTLTVSGVPASTETRSYTSSAQLITEIANARVWGGVHFRFSTTAGTAIGIAVARFDDEHALQPDWAYRAPGA
jgi:PAP2 superfamily protein